LNPENRKEDRGPCKGITPPRVMRDSVSNRRKIKSWKRFDRLKPSIVYEGYLIPWITWHESTC
jgi:hypothetical protein